MKTRTLVIMASRRQDQDLVAQLADNAEGRVVPSFGWHPWFCHHIIVDDSPTTEMDAAEHYQQVIAPCPTESEFLSSLPEPVLLSDVLAQMRRCLENYPDALIGEIGLDRSFRIPGTETLDWAQDPDSGRTSGGRHGHRLSRYRVVMQHQQKVLTAQLNLAGELGRAVSIHGVGAHGTLHDTIAATWKGQEKLSRRQLKDAAATDCLDSPKDAVAGSQNSTKSYPPRICLHSFSGQPDTVRQYLRPHVPATIFFSFSSLVNFSSESQKAYDTIKAVPDDRLLVESDLDTFGELLDEKMEDVSKRVCEIKGWSLTDGISQLSSNWHRFVYG